MFALIVERQYSTLANVPEMLQTWIMAAGGLALVCLLIWALAGRGRRGQTPPQSSRGGGFLTVLVLGLILAFLPYGMTKLWPILGWGPPRTGYELNLNLSGRAIPDAVLFEAILVPTAMGVVAVLLPVLRDLARLRARRIWAIARLSFKEAVRRRVLWVAFAILVIVFMFAPWFVDSKPEHQLRSYVWIMYLAMGLVLILAAGLLSAFSIPTDLKSQTMHTIVTKPVERFEIVLGRSLGYILLMTLALGGMTLCSLVFVARNIGPEATEESYKARVPIFGNFYIMEKNRITEGINVGREWDYRKYISGGATTERAVWQFDHVPADLGKRPTVRCEFSFDIFRTTKGPVENKGIFCTFMVMNPKWKPENINEYKAERDKILANPDPQLVKELGDDRDKLRAALLNPLAEKFGYYELLSKEVIDYHTLFLEIPGGVFVRPSAEEAGPNPRDSVMVNVRCESPTQYLGVARHDLYLLDAEQLFAVNYFKGVAGLWFRLCIIIGLAVMMSTYLSGIIAFLTTMFIYIMGLFVDFILQVAEGKLQGGGPLEAMLRIGQGANLVTPLDRTPTVLVAQGSDFVFRGFLRGVVYLIPEVDRYDLTNYVSNGFNISTGLLFWDNILPVVGYLVPCAVLAYYLMKSREVAA